MSSSSIFNFLTTVDSIVGPPDGSGGGYERLPGEIAVEHDLGEEEPGLVRGLEDIEVGGK